MLESGSLSNLEVAGAGACVLAVLAGTFFLSRPKQPRPRERKFKLVPLRDELIHSHESLCLAPCDPFAESTAPGHEAEPGRPRALSSGSISSISSCGSDYTPSLTRGSIEDDDDLYSPDTSVLSTMSGPSIHSVTESSFQLYSPRALVLSATSTEAVQGELVPRRGANAKLKAYMQY